MVNKVRDELQVNYVDRMIEDMDTRTMAMLLSDFLHEKLEDLTDEQLYNEVYDFYPELTEEINYNGETGEVF